MKIFISGRKDYIDWETFQEQMNLLFSQLGEITEIACGGWLGVDGMVDDYAWKHNIPCKKYPIEWKKHGNLAGRIRNRLMLKEFQPDVVVSFCGDWQTADMIDRAQTSGVRTIIEINMDDKQETIMDSVSFVPIVDLKKFLNTPIVKPYLPLQWINVNDWGPMKKIYE